MNRLIKGAISIEQQDTGIIHTKTTHTLHLLWWKGKVTLVCHNVNKRDQHFKQGSQRTPYLVPLIRKEYLARTQYSRGFRTGHTVYDMILFWLYSPRTPYLVPHPNTEIPRKRISLPMFLAAPLIPFKCLRFLCVGDTNTLSKNPLISAVVGTLSHSYQHVSPSELYFQVHLHCCITQLC